MSSYDRPAYDMSTGKGPDDVESRQDAPQAAPPRQQLPSLSSLFGPAPPVRPLRSPLLDRPSSYSSGSPAGPAPPVERSYSSSSYFPPAAATATSQPRSAYELPHDSRSPYPPQPSWTSHPAPISPRVGEGDRFGAPPRSDYGQPGKWPGGPEPGRSDYASGSREPLLYRPPADRYPPQMNPPKYDTDPIQYRDHQRPQHVSPGGLPMTPSSSTVTSEGVPAKDGLGPKIWTGTHFLPRFVRAAEVPGEGMCYFYDDGSHCKTVIDGEAVNAHWGVTKAGKPRKRLAIACVTCREKKIKCDPDYPRCVQCEKFGRVCKFKNAPRGGHNTSPGTPPAEPDQTRRLGGLIRPPPESPVPPSTSSASLSPRTTVRPASPELMGLPAKRMRTGYDQYHAPPPPSVPQTSTGGQPSPLVATPDSARPGVPIWQPGPELPRIHEDVLARAWQTDPYVSDPQSVTSTITSSFVHLGSTGLGFLPEAAFMAWIQNSASAHHRKSPEEATLVYSLLALGVALSGGSRRIASEYADVARYGADRASLSLPLVQARIVLSLYYISESRLDEAGDVGTAATLAAIALQLNMEMDQAQDATTTAFPYDVDRNGYAESRRRTFFACYTLERLSGAFPYRPTIIHKEDIFLRLPCDNDGFGEPLRAAAPFFDGQSTQSPDGRDLGITAYLIQIVGIWEDVMAGIYRTAHRDMVFDSDTAHFRQTITRRLEEWRLSLPARLSSEGANTSGLEPGDRSTIVLMHLLHHTTFIKLYRHVRHSPPTSASDVEQSASVAREHARQLLRTWCAFAWNLAGAGGPQPSHPFASTAVVEAVDVLSAEGSCAELPGLLDQMRTARSGAAALSTVWTETQVHGLALDRRLELLQRVVDFGREANNPGQGLWVFDAPGVQRPDASASGQSPGLRWQITDPMERRFPREMDYVYSTASA